MLPRPIGSSTRRGRRCLLHADLQRRLEPHAREPRQHFSRYPRPRPSPNTSRGLEIMLTNVAERVIFILTGEDIPPLRAHASQRFVLRVTAVSACHARICERMSANSFLDSKAGTRLLHNWPETPSTEVDVQTHFHPYHYPASPFWSPDSATLMPGQRSLSSGSPE